MHERCFVYYNASMRRHAEVAPNPETMNKSVPWSVQSTCSYTRIVCWLCPEVRKIADFEALIEFFEGLASRVAIQIVFTYRPINEAYFIQIGHSNRILVFSGLVNFIKYSHRRFTIILILQFGITFVLVKGVQSRILYNFGKDCL